LFKLHVNLFSDNFVYVDCPFSNEQYYFTFSKAGNADYCSGQTSTAHIANEVIALKSCYDFSLVNKGNIKTSFDLRRYKICHGDISELVLIKQ